MKNEPHHEESEVPMVEKEKYMRLAADVENLRKAQAAAATELSKWAAQSVITDMLELADAVDITLAHAPPEVIGSAWCLGLEQVSKQFLEKMKRYGVSKIETVGHVFNPVTMEAVQMVPGGESHHVKEEVLSGYLMHERVLRPARVILYE